MSQQDSFSNPVFTKLIPPDITVIGRKNLETLAAVQKELLAALTKANRAWVTYLNEEVAVTSNFTNKVIATRSIPDAAAAYQEWMAQQIELFSKQARGAVDDTQGFTKVCTKLLADGEGLASSLFGTQAGSQDALPGLRQH